MIMKLLLIILGLLASCVGFFAIRWMNEMDKKWEAMQRASEGSKRDINKLTARVDKLEDNSVVQRHCVDTVSLFSQKVNRERHRINALEELLRAGGLIQLVKKFQQKQKDDFTEE